MDGGVLMTEQEALKAEAIAKAEAAAELIPPEGRPGVTPFKVGFVEGYFAGASRTPVAAPSDTDREAALRAVVEVARGKMSDTEWLIAGREPLTAYRIYAEAILAAGFSRASQPVQVTAEMVERAAKGIFDSRRYGESWDRARMSDNADRMNAVRGCRDEARAALMAALGGGE
jgi:hypothetical protein